MFYLCISILLSFSEPHALSCLFFRRWLSNFILDTTTDPVAHVTDLSHPFDLSTRLGEDKDARTIWRKQLLGAPIPSYPTVPAGC